MAFIGKRRADKFNFCVGKMNVHTIICIVAIITGVLVSKTLSESKSCKRQECDAKMTVPLIDDQNIPLTASFDMSKANERIKQFVAEAIEEKMAELTKMKLEDVLSSMNLEKNLKSYVDSLENNLTVNITPEIQKAAQEQVKLENTRLWKEEVALSICTAINNNGYTRAVRRTFCSDGKGGNCNNVCKSHRLGACFDAVHVYTRGMNNYTKTFKYGSAGCAAGYCGPNVCCCR